MIGRRLVAALALTLACGGPPQQTTEAAVVYRASFTAEEGVSTKVVFPLPDDASRPSIESGLSVTDDGVLVTDGGVVSYVSMPEGVGLALEGHGKIEATFSAKAVRGYPDSTGAPDISLTRRIGDAGTNYAFAVNKGGSPVAQVDFEYTASRDCGAGCGGSRSFKYAGPVGLAVQTVTLNYVEEKR